MSLSRPTKLVSPRERDTSKRVRALETSRSSETGTGKTLAYLLPLFSKIDPTQRTLQSIIVVPTHELAMQIAQVGRDLAQHAGMEIRLQVLIGGASIKKRRIAGLKEDATSCLLLRGGFRAHQEQHHEDQSSRDQSFLPSGWQLMQAESW